MDITKKRFFVFCALVVCVVILPITRPVLKIDFAQNATYMFYTSQRVNGIDGTKIINCGTGSIVCCGLDSASKIKLKLNGILGESVRVKNYNKKTMGSLKARFYGLVVKTETLDGYKIWYCYDASLPKFVTLSGQKINIQIAIDHCSISIGYPLILTGF